MTRVSKTGVDRRVGRTSIGVEGVAQDLRYAWRQTWRRPGFTAVAVLTLALGIGANSAIFSLVDAVLLRTLPVDRPEQLVLIEQGMTRGGTQNISRLLFEQLREERSVFSGVFAAQDGLAVLSVGSAAADAVRPRRCGTSAPACRPSRVNTSRCSARPR